jgi:hypothetical protein
MSETKSEETVNQLEEIASSVERTRTIAVIERVVASDSGTPTEREKTTNVFVRPLPFRRWPKAISCITGMLRAFPDDGINFEDSTALGLLIAQLVGEADVELFTLLTLATDQDDSFFDRIDLDDGVKIALAVVEVNKDFFVQKVLPLATEAMPSIKEQITEMSGQTQ